MTLPPAQGGQQFAPSRATTPVQSVIWPIQAGGGPWTVVPNTYGVPCIRGGVIGGGGRGNIDEYMVIEGDGKIAGLADAEKYMVDMLDNYVQATSDQS